MNMTNIYKILCDAKVDRDQLFAVSSNSEVKELLSLGSSRTRNFFAEPAAKLCSSSSRRPEDAKPCHGHKNRVDKRIAEKSIEDLHAVMLPLALDIKEKLGLGK